jgi:hypothetical protein
MAVEKNIIISQLDKIVTADVNNNITGINTAAYSANLGPVGSVTITGGTNGQVLSTNGSGTLSWTTPSSGGGGLSGPAFLATTSGSVIANGTMVNIPAGTVVLNSGSCYNTSTYVFTPTTAGYYQIGASSKTNTNMTFSEFYVMIYKNGSFYRYLYNMGSPSAAIGPFGFSAVATLVPMNGTTDYLEIKWYGYPANGPGSMINTFIEGTYLRGL